MIYWTKPTESGLGDRLSDILLIATYARALKTEVTFTWETYRGHENPSIRQLDPLFRYIDTDLNNIKKYIIFPDNVIVKPYIEIENQKFIGWITDPKQLNIVRSKYETFENSLGGAVIIFDFWNNFLKDKLPFNELQKSFNTTIKGFGFCSEINSYLSTLPERFMSFHIRRGDKVRSENTDGTYIHSDEIEELNNITYECLEYFSEKYDHFFICSDQDEKKAEFVDYLTSKGKNIISLPPGLEKWQQTYYDMATMTKSDTNIASNRYSSFSCFPSIIGNKMWRNVFDWKASNL